MKKICFVCYDFSMMGGAEKVVHQLSESLKNYYQIHILSLCHKNHKPAYPLSPEISYYNLVDKEARLREIWTKSFADLRKYISENKVDVVMLIGYYNPAVAAALRIFTRAKLVFCDHGSLLNQIDDKEAVMLRRIGAKFCHKVISLTERDCNDYQRIFKLKPQKCSYIYNYLDDEIFKHTAEKYNADSKKIITVGRISEEKGFDMLVDVAKIVLEKHKDWQWHIWGDGEKFGHIKSLIEKNNLQDRLILKGQTRDIYDKYKDYGLYVLTSYREGLPLVLLEAKANRLPIVSFDCTTGPREIVCDGQDGFLIPCYDKQMMAEKICTLIEDSSLRERFSENSQNNLKKFDKDVILQQWRDLIEEVSGK